MKRLLSGLLDLRIALYLTDHGATCDAHDGPVMEAANALRLVAVACELARLPAGAFAQVREGFAVCAAAIAADAYDARQTPQVDAALVRAAALMSETLKPDALGKAWGLLKNAS